MNPFDFPIHPPPTIPISFEELKAVQSLDTSNLVPSPFFARLPQPDNPRSITESLVDQKQIPGQFLEMMNLLLEDLNEEQKEKLVKLTSKIKNPNDMSIQQATKLINDLGIDIEGIQKKMRKKKAEEKEKNKKVKIGANESCICGSGKKYKKCCRFKEDRTEKKE